MPVQTIPAGPRAAVRFIVCDKRSDINRVVLTTAHVDQWKCDAEALARFVVEQLGLRRSRHRVDASGTRPLGLAAGDTRHQMLGLRTYGDVPSAQRRPGHQPRRHPPERLGYSRAGRALNEGRGINPGDTVSG